MRITPLDIRKQEFKRVMRGLDVDEVHAFLNTVAEEYEAVLSDNKNLREKIVAIEERLNEYKSIEMNLRNTLLTAEKLTQEAKDNARREASLIVRQAEMEAEKAADGIRSHTAQLRREILELKKNKDNYLSRLRTLIEGNARMLEGYAEDFAGVDQAIERIGKQVEEDASRPAAPNRMSRDKITQDFGHEPKDKVTWGDERRVEEEPRPQMPRPAGERGESQDRRPKPPESANAFAAPRMAPASDEPPRAQQRPDESVRRPEPRPAQPAEQMRMEPMTGASGVGTSAPERPEPAAGAAPQPPQDDWRGYEVRKQAVDWKSYVIPEKAAPEQSAPPPKPVSPLDAELDNALSSLQEAAGKAELPPQPRREPQQAQRQAPPQAAAAPPKPRPEPVSAETTSDQTWSMDDLRRNLSNLSQDEGNKS